MTKGRVRRTPDGSVATAVATVTENTKFKRMLLFGLRSLSDSCVPPNGKYKENSIDALERGVVPALTAATQTFIEDEETLALGAKILWGISEGIKDEPDEMLMQKMIDDGGIDAMVAIINTAPSDTDLLDLAMDFVDNMAKAGVEIDPSAMAGGMLECLSKGKLPTKTSARVMAALVVVAETEDGSGIEVLGAAQTTTKILSYISANGTMDQAGVMMAESGMKCVAALADGGVSQQGDLDICISVMEMYKGKRNVTNEVSAAMAAMIGPDQLKQCLVALSQPVGSEARDSALTMLSSLSYIPSYADEIVQAGGVPLLVAAVKSSSAEIAAGRESEKLINGMAGALKMLGQIAANPANTDVTYGAGALKATTTALQQCSAHEAVSAACCDCLAPLANKESYAREMSGCYPTVLDALYNHVETNPEVAKAAMSLLANASQHTTVASILINGRAVDICSTCCQYNMDDLPFQIGAMTTLNSLAPNLTTCADMYNAAGLQGISATLSANKGNEELALQATTLCSRLVQVPDATTYMCDGSLADAILEAMLAHQDNSGITAAGTSALEVIATDNDVQRTLADLERAIQGANNDPERCIKVLAAVSGLSRIERLRQVFVQHQADKTIVKGVSGWIESKTANQECITAATAAFQKIIEGGDNNLEENIQQVMNVLAVPQMKQIIDKQDVNDNNALDLLKAAESFAMADRLSSIEAIFPLAEGIVKVMRKFPDSRKINIRCITILSLLASSQNGGGASQIVQSGACKSVVSYMGKCPMHSDVQIAGFKLLSMLAKNDPDAVEVLKRSGAIELINTATRTHSKTKEVKRAVAPLAALLMPVDHLEREIAAQLAAMTEATQNNNIAMLCEAQHTLNELLVSAEGAKIASRLKVGDNIKEAMVYLSSSTGEDTETLCTSFAALAETLDHVSSVRVGEVHLTKNGNVEDLITTFERLLDLKGADQADGVVHSLNATRRLMRGDINNADIAMKRGMVVKICTAFERYPDDPRVLAASCGAIAAMAATPKRAQELVKSPEFQRMLGKLNDAITKNPKTENKALCIEAVRSLIETNDAALVTEVIQSGSVSALFNILDNYGDDKTLVKEAAETLNLIGNFADLKAFWESQHGTTEYPLQVLTRNLRKHKLDADISLELLKLTNKYCTSQDREMLKEMGMLEIVSDFLMTHSDNEKIVAECGELLGKLGADELIAGTMRQIIAVEQNKDGNWTQEIAHLSNQLAVLMAARVVEVDTAFGETEACLTALASGLQADGDNVRLQTGVAAVSQRLVDRFWDEPDSSYGSWAVTSSGLSDVYMALLNPQSGYMASRNKKFVMASHRAMAGCANNPYTRAYLLGSVESSNHLETCSDILSSNSDPDVIGRVLEFLKEVADDKDGTAVGAAMLLPSSGKFSPDIMAATLGLMNKHKKSDAVVCASYGLIGALAANSNESVIQIANGKAIKDMQTCLSNDSSKERQLAYSAAVAQIVGAGLYGPALAQTQPLKQAVVRFNHVEEAKELDEQSRIGVAIATANLIQAYGNAGLYEDTRKAGSMDALCRMMEEYPNSAEVQAAAAVALASLAGDEETRTRIIRDALPIVTANMATVHSDIALCDATCDLLSAVAQKEGCGRELAEMKDYDALMDGMDQCAAAYEDPYADMVKDKVARVRAEVDNDIPHVPTLKEIYESFLKKKEAGEPLLVADSAILQGQVDFALDHMEEYNKEPLNMENPLGIEFMYGCMAMQILSETKENVDYLAARKLAKLLVSSIKSQQDENVIQYAVQCGCEYSRQPVGATSIAKVPKAPNILTDSCVRARKMKISNEEREELLCPRLQLIERVAVSRNVFNQTKVMDVLLALWDDTDKSVFTTTLLRHVFRDIRRVVSDVFVETLLKANVLKRLIVIIEDRNVDPVLLPDVLFLLGSLAVVPEIKTKIGEIGGIQAIVQLLERVYEDKAVSAVVTNSCLALANITISHDKNIQIFTKLKGADLNVSVLRARADDFDVANAASVLLCNLCYKREDMKKLFGKNGAAAGLVNALQQYDGSAEKGALRFLGSLFKAVANLSLYTPNVKEFLVAEIEKSYEHILTNSQNLPNHGLETALRTLSNLVMENDEGYMQQFGVLTLPMLTMVQQGGRDEVTMLTLTFEVLGCLTRLPANAQLFADGGGIETTLRVMRSQNDPHLISMMIYCLGIQSTIPESVPLMTDNGLFDLLIGIFESQISPDGNEAADLCVSCLRCCRRCIQTTESALVFIEAGGVPSILELINFATEMPMVELESYRVILTLIDRNPPPLGPEGETTDADGYPLRPRPYETVGLDETQIANLISTVTNVLTNGANVKQLRLQRVGMGILTYFAVEKNAVEEYIRNDVVGVLSNNVEYFAIDHSTLEQVGLTTANICYSIQDNPELLSTFTESKLATSLPQTASKLPAKDPSQKEFKAKIQAMAEGFKSGDFTNGVMYPFALTLSEFDKDPYPNGVQDLPKEMKDILRKGERKLKVLVDEKSRENWFYRSSQDLQALQWKVGKEKDFINAVAIVRIKNVSKGLNCEVLRKANKREPRNVFAQVCLTIFGPPTEEFPNGLELALKAKTKKERDEFVEMMVAWRDAATYGY
eukprot:GHVN01001571.1.p1 GENE.GHVN01001571.1~~GHVN01001571.1.p1  ORF type:complete len:2595 (+),score=325.02 GHVN01001571.1:17885-25669(+)